MSRFPMSSSSSLISSSSIFSIVVKLTGKFTSLEEPTDDSNIAIVAFFLPMDPISSNLRGESNPKSRCESSDF
jgi:hypothetical protein